MSIDLTCYGPDIEALADLADVEVRLFPLAAQVIRELLGIHRARSRLTHGVHLQTAPSRRVAGLLPVPADREPGGCVQLLRSSDETAHGTRARAAAGHPITRTRPRGLRDRIERIYLD